MRRWAIAAGATGMALLSLASQVSARQVQSDPLVAKAVNYVRDYTKAMASVVCEERQTQRVVKHDGKVKKTREITSEVAFVDAGGAHAFSLVVFRDVMTVDGKPVRNREERLRKLLISGRKQDWYKQAERITEEGTRYDIGGFANGNGNVDPLVMAVWWFQGHLASGKFMRTADTVSFSQGTRRPEDDRRRSGSIAIRGHYVLDSQGRVLKTFWATDDPDFDSAVTVGYREQPNLTALVPSEMLRHEHRLRDPKSDMSVAQATYSNCRQFQVTVEETIQLPAPAR